MSTARIVAGIGCTGAAGADSILALIALCLAEANRGPSDLACLATTARRSGHEGIRAAARRLGVELRVLDDATLRAADEHITAISEAAQRHTGLKSVAEAAALAAGPLLAARRKGDGVTCALSQAGEDFDPKTFGRRA